MYKRQVLNDAKFEDPTILVEYSKELKQTIIQGQGEHHLNILRSRIEKENKLAYEYIAPKIPYRETITKVAQADYRHKKQSGGAGQFGEVHMLSLIHISHGPAAGGRIRRRRGLRQPRAHPPAPARRAEEN